MKRGELYRVVKPSTRDPKRSQVFVIVSRQLLISVLLGASHTVLEGLENIGEEGVLDLSRRYFVLLKTRTDTGKTFTETFAYWREVPDIRSLLRGKQREQVSFLVLDDEEGTSLHEAIEKALAIADRGERREGLQRLAGAVQKRTVSVYAGRDLHPEDYAYPLGPFWVPQEGWYSPGHELIF